MKALLKSNISFLRYYLIFLLLGGVLLGINSKVDLHLGFNAFHHPVLDLFFSYITYLGDGLMALMISLLLLTVKYRYALIVGVSNILASSITQILKQTLFNDALRPKKYFEGLQDLYFVPGIENHMYHSFPSGHATCAFALYFSLTMLVRNKNYKLLFFITALLIAYSRVYLSQHFFADVYVGSIIGVGGSLLVYLYFKNKQQPWMERSLISSLKKDV